jgi:hypothetical protein
MSALLDDIINLAEDDRQSLPNLLRKCLRLASELKIERIKTWADQELSGYKDWTTLPEYRIIGAHAYGNFAGWFNSWYPNHLIVPAAMEPEHRKWAEQVYLVQSVSALDDLAKMDAAKGIFTSPWPPNMVAYYQTKLMPECVCHDAWQEIPKSALIEVLDTVRNTTLRMALEIKEELGTSYAELSQIRSGDVRRIENIVINNLGGNVALGNVNSSGQTVLVSGDRKVLHAALTRVGLDHADLNELDDAIRLDGEKSLGSSVTEWIKAKASKVVTGGIKVSVSIGQQLLTEFLMQHYGLKK